MPTVARPFWSLFGWLGTHKCGITRQRVGRFIKLWSWVPMTDMGTASGEGRGEGDGVEVGGGRRAAERQRPSVSYPGR